MNAKEERKKILEQFMRSEVSRDINLRDRLRGKKRRVVKFGDMFTLAGCIYKTMVWGHYILCIEKYNDNDEVCIALPHFLDAIINGKEIIAPLFSANDLTVGGIAAKAQQSTDGEEAK